MKVIPPELFDKFQEFLKSEDQKNSSVPEKKDSEKVTSHQDGNQTWKSFEYLLQNGE